MTEPAYTLVPDLDIKPWMQQLAAQLAPQMMQKLKLTTTEQMAICGLGLADYLAWRSGTALLPVEAYMQVSMFLETHRFLKLQQKSTDDIAAWMRTPKRALGGNNPVNHMIGLGMDGVREVCELAALEAEMPSNKATLN